MFPSRDAITDKNDLTKQFIVLMFFFFYSNLLFFSTSSTLLLSLREQSALWWMATAAPIKGGNYVHEQIVDDCFVGE